MQYIAGTSIALFTAALILNKREKAPSDKYMLIWMLLNAVHLGLNYAYNQWEALNMPFLYGIMAPLPLLHGVMLYLYVAAVTNQFPRKKYQVWIHFIPAILFYAYLSTSFFTLSPAEQTFVLKNKGVGYEAYLILLLVCTNLSGITYVLWSTHLLRKHKKNIREQFSELAKIDLRWLQFLTYGLGIIWTIVIFTQHNEAIFTSVVIYVVLAGFFGIQQINIFKTIPAKTGLYGIQQQNDDKEPLSSPGKKQASEEKAPHHRPPNQSQGKEKYLKSGLTEAAANQMYSDLIRLVEEKSVYKTPELSIGDLAASLKTHPNYLSQVINEKAGQPFYDFINTYRVEAFKQMIADPQYKQYTILALAYECGFNSKSSFNRYFKKITGQTPSQYQKSLS